MTSEIARIARLAGAVCHTDPFVPNARPTEAGLMGRLFGRDGARKLLDVA
jgi:hypothetical protein